MKQAVVVLGMHRSGTSSLAGALCLLGARPPKTLMPGHEDNPKGYWESLPVVYTNDAILKSAGSSWTDWRPFNPYWGRSAAGKATTEQLPTLIRDEFDDAPLILLKDPRICRLFPVWRDALEQSGYQPFVVVPLRSPMEVAASLTRRDGFSEARALLIWLRHVLEAERSTRSVPRHFMSWPAFVDDWRTGVADLQERLDIALPAQSDFVADEVDTFLDGRLRRQVHERPIPGSVPKWIDETFQALLKLVDNPSDRGAQATLDDVRSQFDTTAKIYGPVLAGLETERRLWQDEHDAERQDLATRLSTTIQERDVQMVARADTETLLHQYMASTSAAEQQVATLQAALDNERQAHAAAQAQAQEDAQTATGERIALSARLDELAVALQSTQDQVGAAETTLAITLEQSSSLSSALDDAQQRLATADHETGVLRHQVQELRDELDRGAAEASRQATEIGTLQTMLVNAQAAASAAKTEAELNITELQRRLAHSETALESAKDQLTALASQGLLDRVLRKPSG